MIIFLPNGPKGDISEWAIGVMARFIAWFIVFACVGMIQQYFLPADFWINIIPAICGTIHIMVYTKLYDKKKNKENRK